jgi:PTH1 family peptidyl-tRNA hydrolase
MKLFVGLGNPGAKYANNRHNVGFLALDRIAERHSLGSWRRRFQGETAEGSIGGERVLLLKPTTYMNDSGQSVGEAARFLKVPVEDIYVFHDEIDLAPGKLKVKSGGGNAGHNGLRSITAHMGNDYHRVRIGVGHPGAKDAVAHYVLHDFAKVEYAWLDPLLDAMAAEARYLASGDSSRFLSHVAAALRETGDDRGEDRAEDRGEAQDRAGGPAGKSGAAERRAEPSSRPAKGHPAGERAGKRATALADNLKKWLAGRGDKE